MDNTKAREFHAKHIMKNADSEIAIKSNGSRASDILMILLCWPEMRKA